MTETETETIQPAPLAEKPKRKSKPAAPKKERVIDPDIAILRDEHKTKVAQLRFVISSARILKTIKEKRIPKMTAGDREKLMDELKLTATPALPGIV